MILHGEPFILDFKTVLLLPISSTYISSLFFMEILEMPLPIFFKTNHTCRGSSFIFTKCFIHWHSSLLLSPETDEKLSAKMAPVVLPLPNHCKLRVKSCLTRALTPQCGSTWFDASLVQGKTSLHLPTASWGREGSSGDMLQEHSSAPCSQLDQ